jgi:hypothetical protein
MYHGCVLQTPLNVTMMIVKIILDYKKGFLLDDYILE